MTHHRPFRFGVKSFLPPDHDGWVAFARKVEALGYSTLSIDDHVGLPLSTGRPCSEPSPRTAVSRTFDGRGQR